MEIIVLILIALRSLISPDMYTEEYKKTHQAEIDKAIAIYNSDGYIVKEGGVIIDDGINPQ